MIYLCMVCLQAQVHLIGNVAVWYTGTTGIAVYCILLVWYMLRRRRQCFDISEGMSLKTK
jgi:dolichyl-phosphate-mannose-protein mannosyltransferase